ncbi:MAG: hypothetical protein WAQ07_04490 [Candidatus Omnitrophota bacterium]
MSALQVALLEPAKVVLAQVGQFLVSILLVIFILIVGWAISIFIKFVVTRGLRLVRLDELSDFIELETILEKGGIGYSLSELIGVICYWIGILVTFVVAINAVGLAIAADLLNRIILYVPNVVSAVFILILGMFAATVLKNIVVTTANNSGLPYGKLLGKVSEVIVIAFAIFIGLEQLNIGVGTIHLILSIALGSLGLGFAIAFGLGCKDTVGKLVADFLEKLKKK